MLKMLNNDLGTIPINNEPGQQVSRMKRKIMNARQSMGEDTYRECKLHAFDGQESMIS